MPKKLLLDRWLLPRLLAMAALVAALLMVAAPASAERQVRSLPHVETFDTNAYQNDIVWVQQGATHTWMPSGGWRGGAAKFTPVLTGEGMSALGQFIVSGLNPVPAQINVRFLIYHGGTWNQFGPGNKLVIMNRSGNGGRPMIITRHVGTGTSRWETWGACDGTVCRYEGGDFFPDGTDTLRIGNTTGARERQWISVEFEANTTTGMIRLYVDTQDGAMSGLYIERPMDDTGAGGVWSYIDTIGGYMATAERADPENFFMIDELTIDSRKIGPPAGFTTNVPRPSPATGVSAQ